MQSQVLADIGVIFVFSSALLFILGYTLLAPWWGTAVGWARISLDFGILLLASPSFLKIVFGVTIRDVTILYWYSIVAIFFVGVVPLWNLFLVARAQLKELRRNRLDRQQARAGEISVISQAQQV